jgi:DNA-binding protein HU-beta
MTKDDLVREIAARTGFNKADIKTIIETFLQLVKESLLEGMSVQLRGFGSFFRKKRASKKARNLAKGTTIDIPACEVPAYRPSREFVDTIKSN